MKFRDLFTEEDVPVNNVGSGDIAGVGVGPSGEPGVDPRVQKKHKKKTVLRDVFPGIVPGV